MTEEQKKTFRQAAQPMMDWMAANVDPHATVTVTGGGAELHHATMGILNNEWHYCTHCTAQVGVEIWAKNDGLCSECKSEKHDPHIDAVPVDFTFENDTDAVCEICKIKKPTVVSPSNGRICADCYDEFEKWQAINPRMKNATSSGLITCLNVTIPSNPSPKRHINAVPVGFTFKDDADAIAVVSKELVLLGNGIIHCSEKQWQKLSPEAAAAVRYLLDEWDFATVDAT